MEAFALYLLKSVIWLTGFALVFLIFLRNERFFLLNRIYLVAGIITSFLFPFISVHYTVVLPVVRSIGSDATVVNAIQKSGVNSTFDIGFILLTIYSLGVLFVFTQIIRQSSTVLKSIKKAGIVSSHPVKLIKTTDYTSAFSFFSYVFVNPSITDPETKEIVNHELVHIRQKHWFDLVLAELLCMLQWFNPLTRIYIRFIRQNHEYLADEVALQCTSDPAIYRAALLNQIVGSPVVSLANSFNYSVNQKRFNMMKNIISSPYRKLKIFLILPVFAIVLYSFAKPDYKYVYTDEKSDNNDPALTSSANEVKGVVVRQDGTPLAGTTIMLRGTNTGTAADERGFFKLVNVPDDGLLVITYIGFKSKVIKPDFASEMVIMMTRDTVKYLDANISVPPPPPPPPPPPAKVTKGTSDAGAPPPPPPPPLYVIDGKVSEKHYNPIPQENIESMKVLRADIAKDKYGEKARYGAVVIVTKHKYLGSQDKAVTSSSEAIPVPPPPPPPPPATINFKSVFGTTPLFVADGRVISESEFKLIDANTIQSIDVLKDKSATALYGDKAKDGVMVIRTNRKGVENQSKVVIRNTDGSQAKPLIVLDGVANEEFETGDVDPMEISNISVIKGEPAVRKYGDKAKDGAIEITTKSKDLALIVIDGVITDKKIKDITVAQMEKVVWLRGQEAIDKYGDKGKYGVDEITTRDPKTKLLNFKPLDFNSDSDVKADAEAYQKEKEMASVIEEQPEFQGGIEAMSAWIINNVKYPGEAVKAKITGKVFVDFLVSSTGKVKNVTVSKPVNPLLDAEAIRVVSSMPDWKPGSQTGKAVDVQMQVPVEFKLK